MIRVGLTVLVFIYLFLFLTAVFAIWFRYEWGLRRKERRAVRFRVRCSICAFEFEDVSKEALVRCPRCGALNERCRMSLL